MAKETRISLKVMGIIAASLGAPYTRPKEAYSQPTGAVLRVTSANGGLIQKVATRGA